MTVATCVAALLVVLLLFVLGDAVERVLSYEPYERRLRLINDPLDRLRPLVLPPGRGRRLLASGLPVYDLRIPAAGLIRLQEMMERVVVNGKTDGLPEPRSERAEFRWKGDWLPVQVRTRGWASNHYNRFYPSLRLQFPSTSLFEHMRQINLVDPYDKLLAADATVLWEAERHGILTWLHRFVVLRVNGKPLGLYREIEQPGVEMTDRLGRSEGYIFSAGGQLFGKPGFAFDKAASARDRLREWLSQSPPAEAQLDEFIATDFDSDRMAWAAAIMSLTGHWGQWLADNVRLYFDPARGRFEPIPWDYGYMPLRPSVTVRIPTGGARVLREDGECLCDLGLVLMRSARFRSLRDRRLWVLINERVEPMVEHSRRGFESIRAGLENDLRRVTLTDATAIETEFAETLRDNARYLKTLYQENGLRATWSNSPGAGIVIELENAAKAAAEVTSLFVETNGRVEERGLPEVVEVPGRWKGRGGRAQIHCQAAPSSRLVGVGARNSLTKVGIEGRQLMLQRSGAPLVIWPQPPVRLPAPRLAGVAVRGDEVRFGPGRVEVRDTTEIPAGYRVVFEPGLDLRLGPGVSLLLNGDLKSVGRPDAPIRISDLNGVSTWGVLGVQGQRTRPARVEVRHTEFHGGSGGQSRSVVYTGSFSVHDGDITLEHVSLTGGTIRDDGFNFKYSAVRLDDVQILDQPSDAIDLDFCTGEITRFTVRNVGGDAFDISGSQVTFRECDFVKCGDKGISIGEKSRAVVIRTKVRQARIGVAVKDESEAILSDCSIGGGEIGVALYVKKPSFGYPAATLNRTEIAGAATRFLLAPGCSLNVNGETKR